MQIQLSPEHAALVQSQSEAVGRTPTEVVGDILDLYSIASQMAPIIPPPDPRDVVDSWDPNVAAE